MAVVSQPARPEAAAMRVSLAVGFFMLAAKTGAWLLTGSAAIFSDAAESVVHVLAVAFATFSVWLSDRPAGSRAPFGFERIAFFSAGFEGLVIAAVAILIISNALEKWRSGAGIEHPGAGIVITAVAMVGNGLLGWYLLRTGRRHQSLIVVADAKHVLTDSWTSFGAIAGISLAVTTGWRGFDPLFAIATAVNILYTGLTLLWSSAAGLMDINDARLESLILARLDPLARELGVSYHDVQCRDTGRRLIITLHLLFRFSTPIGEAHAAATQLECRLAADLGRPTVVITHLEAVEDHGSVHTTHPEAAKSRDSAQFSR